MDSRLVRTPLVALFLAGCAVPPAVDSSLGEFARSTDWPPTIASVGVGPASSPDSIVVVIEGAVQRPGSYELPRDATVSSLFALKDGPGFLFCVISMHVVRKEADQVVRYVATSSALTSKSFPLQHGDRILYFGGGF